VLMQALAANRRTNCITALDTRSSVHNYGWHARCASMSTSSLPMHVAFALDG
jgi:hypothetical protein